MKSKNILFVLLFFVSIQFSLAAFAFGLPKPHSTELVSKQQKIIAGNQLTVSQYRSKLSQTQVLDFYNKKLIQQNWIKLEIPMPGLGGGIAQGLKAYSFINDDKLLVLSFSPLKAEGYVFYNISEGSFPRIGQNKKQPLDMFKAPKKVNFMPLYPEAKQVNFSTTTTGVSAGYMASGGIEVVRGFYVQKMPHKGWKLISEQPIDTSGYDFAKMEEDCPTCGKIPEQAKEAMSGVKIRGANLEFKKGKETCLINITQIGMASMAGVDLTSMGLGDTMITVVYNEGK